MTLTTENLNDILRGWQPANCIVNGEVKTKNLDEYYWTYEILPSQYVRGKYFGNWAFIEEISAANGPAAGKIDHHHSVFAHCSEWKRQVDKLGKVGGIKNTSVKLEWLWLEIDGQNIGHSMQIARDILGKGPLQKCLGGCRVFWSGNRSIHIAVDGRLFGNLRGSESWLAGHGGVAYQLAHRLVSHMSTFTFPYMIDEKELMDYCSQNNLYFADVTKARKFFEVIDPNMYEMNRTIRMTNTIHPKTNNPKLEIGVANLFANKIEFYTHKTSFLKPELLYLTVECLKPLAKPSRYYSQSNLNLNNAEHLLVYEHYMHTDGIQSGDWINNLESPFYDDANPSVAINLQTGLYKDFGEPSHVFSVEQFVSKIEGIGIVDAANKIHQILHDNTKLQQNPVRS